MAKLSFINSRVEIPHTTTEFRAIPCPTITFSSLPKISKLPNHPLRRIILYVEKGPGVARTRKNLISKTEF